MLIEFRVENHRSLRDEQVLTMEAGRVGDQADPRPRHIGGTDLELLPVVALYGANASGKTLDALAFMRDAVLNSANRWQPDGAIPRTPFAWSTAKRPSSFFEVAIVVNSIRPADKHRCRTNVVVERMAICLATRKQTNLVQERENGSFKFGDKLKGENKAIEV